MPDKDHGTGQADKFRDMARDLGCDEDETAFEEKVRRVATSPKPEVEPGGN
jgi:hypothetical protein